MLYMYTCMYIYNNNNNNNNKICYMVYLLCFIDDIYLFPTNIDIGDIM